MAEKAGIALLTETHVERYNHDPRRLEAAHEELQRRTDGRLGIRVCADLSHYVHQIGNSRFPQWPSISTGELCLDPFEPDNYISRNIIEKGMVWAVTCARLCRTIYRQVREVSNTRSPTQRPTRKLPICRTAG